MRVRVVVAGIAVAAAAAGPAAAVTSRHAPVTLKAALSSATSTHVGAKVVFGTRRTTVPSGDSIRSYTVKFGDGSRAASGKGLPRTLSHTFRTPGTYTVTLTVTDARHHTSSAKDKLKVTRPVVVAPAPTPAPATPAPPVSTPTPAAPTVAPTTPAPTVAPTTAPPTTAPPTTVPPTTAAPAPAHPASQLAGGSDFTCALITDGTVDCWGENSAGEMGNGTTSDEVDTPTKVPNLSGVTAITAGASHVCALLGAGTVDCWGYNRDGQLGVGVGDDTDRHVPTAVANLTGVTAISAYRELTCAVLSNGTVDCWGLDDYGQVGVGYNNNAPNAQPTDTPQQVVGLTGKAVGITTGYDYACARIAGGTVDCWGTNGNGQLGQGTGAKPEYDSAVAVPGLTGVTQLVAGGQHTCALASGTEKCWGSNYLGQLGDGSGQSQPSPSAVSLTGIASISAGGSDSCAVLTTGAADCWGQDDYGQVGDGGAADGSGSNAVVPTGVSGLAGATQIEVNQFKSACALRGDGSVACWGYDGQGQLGTSPKVSVSKPTATLPLP